MANGLSQLANGMISGGIASQFQSVAQDTPRELPAVLKHLQGSLDTLGSLVDALDGRLTGIVARTEGPVNPSTGVPPRPVMNTGVGAQLDSMNDITQHVSGRLRSLLDRLEF